MNSESPKEETNSTPIPDLFQLMKAQLEKEADSISSQERQENPSLRKKYIFQKALAQLIGNHTLKEEIKQAFLSVQGKSPQELDQGIRQLEKETGISLSDFFQNLNDKIRQRFEKLIPNPDAAEDILKDIYVGKRD